MSRRLVLASRSPQRRAILEQLGLEFDVRPTHAEELEEGDPHEVALANARLKADACDARDGELVLAVDTLVALDGRIYGKPRDEAHARETLRALGGRTHVVISGIAMRGGTPSGAGAGRSPGAGDGVAVTEVDFRPLDDRLLDWYLATGEWRDRAGGYAIQGRGAALVTGIRGDYLNVVGLPVAELLHLMPGLLTDH